MAAREAGAAGGGPPGQLRTFAFSADRARQERDDGGATATVQSETQFDRDGRAIREKVLAQAAAATAAGAAAPADDGTYKGQAGYIDHRQGFRREHTIAAEKNNPHGPLRAPTNVRFTFVMDYKPDICKDYKETGYCGYGDACKFMHDRGDYKHGWQIDKEWEEKEKLRKEREAKLAKGELEGESGDEEEEDDGLPFACLLCRRVWAEVADPVVTKCRHYFCEECALRHNAKSKTCAQCGQPTSGVFNTAKDILAKVKAQREGGGSSRAKRPRDDDGAAAEQGDKFAPSMGWKLG